MPTQLLQPGNSCLKLIQCICIQHGHHYSLVVTLNKKALCIAIGWQNQKDIHLVWSIPRDVQHPGRCSVACGADHSPVVFHQHLSIGTSVLPLGNTLDIPLHNLHQQKSLVFASLIQDYWTRYIDVMSIPWSGMGMVYTLPLFKMLPVVLAKIQQSREMAMILVAMYLMFTSWMPELRQLSQVLLSLCEQ